jgi:hypothetical protein
MRARGGLKRWKNEGSENTRRDANKAIINSVAKNNWLNNPYRDFSCNSS